MSDDGEDSKEIEWYDLDGFDKASGDDDEHKKRRIYDVLDEYDDDENDEQQQQLTVTATIDTSINRPGYNVVDGTNFYNLGSLFVLFYAHVKEGISIPAIFQANSENFMSNNNNTTYDF